MLLLATKLHELTFSSLMEVYSETNQDSAKHDWGNLPDSFALQQAEQAFYLYLKDEFFRTKGACYAVWKKNDVYVCALRLEPYKDGFLMEALETHPDHRRKGYARELIQAVFALFPDCKIYSHVHRKNIASLQLHEVCGFRKILDHAAFVDGSVNYRACTFLHE